MYPPSTSAAATHVFGATAAARGIVLGLLVIAIQLTSFSHAAQPEGNRDDSDIVAPFVLDRTILIAKFDVAGIQIPDPSVIFPSQAAGDDEGATGIRTRLERLAAWIREVRGASGDQAIYMTAGIPMSQVDDPLFFVLESASRADAARLTDLLRITSVNLNSTEQDGMLVLAAENQGQDDADQSSLESVPRPEIDAAFASVSGYPIQLLVVPPEYLRRTVRELVPHLPDALGGGPSAVLTDGVQWAALGVDPGAMRGELVLQSASEDAAQRLVDYLPRLVAPGSLGHEFLSATFAGGLERVADNDQLWTFLVGALVETVREEDRIVVRLREPAAVEGSLRILGTVAVQLQDRLHRHDHEDKFKRILLAMHNYHDTFGAFPPGESVRGEDGRAPLSWRVYLLPFLGEAELYDQFRLDEPWDSPHNRQLIERMPEIYASLDVLEPGHTAFLAPVGEDTVFGTEQAVAFQNISDGTSNTVILVESEPERAVPWTAPRDFEFDPEAPSAGLRRFENETVITGFADGSVRYLAAELDPEILIWLFSKSDGQAMPSHLFR